MREIRIRQDGTEGEQPVSAAHHPRASEPVTPLMDAPGIHGAPPAITLGGESARAAPGAQSAGSSTDALSKDESIPGTPYIDQSGVGAVSSGIAGAAIVGAGPGAGAVVGAAAAGAASAAAAIGPAQPTQLYQLLTSWSGGATEYGFQLKFRCRSTSGNVADLQAQAPGLIWRERVTYSRNDFAHRISPPNPTILPPGGVSFAAASTKRLGVNLLEFNSVTDTHHIPTSVVRAADFATGSGRTLPAVMESHQLYQFSPDGGANWKYFAGSFTIRRTLYRDDAGNLQFTTNKVKIHSITEPYKP